MPLDCDRHHSFTTLQALTGLDRYFAMARGAEGGITALDMSKYLDTNYHYMVPELEAGFVSNPDFSAVVDKVTRAQAALGVAAAVPILIGESGIDLHTPLGGCFGWIASVIIEFHDHRP